MAYLFGSYNKLTNRELIVFVSFEYINKTVLTPDGFNLKLYYFQSKNLTRKCKLLLII